jgi:hypothetical protein
MRPHGWIQEVDQIGHLQRVLGSGLARASKDVREDGEQEGEHLQRIRDPMKNPRIKYDPRKSHVRCTEEPSARAARLLDLFS